MKKVMCKIKTTYETSKSMSIQEIQKIDDSIRKLVENTGAEWYSQGLDYRTQIRDICFYLGLNII